MFKRITVIAMLLALVFLTVAPETFARCNRNRRAYYRTAYYSPYRYQSGYYSPYRYRSGYYSPYRYRGVAGQRYYAYNGYRRRNHSTRNLILSVAAPGAIGAGVGALFGGGKGAGIGALLGAGGGAAYYLIKHRNRRY